MSQHYSDPRCESDPHALPDLEVFWADDLLNEEGDPLDAGWYYWPCFPGCLPDGDPIGPFDTKAEALADARDAYDGS